MNYNFYMTSGFARGYIEEEIELENGLTDEQIYQELCDWMINNDYVSWSDVDTEMNIYTRNGLIGHDNEYTVDIDEETMIEMENDEMYICRYVFDFLDNRIDFGWSEEE